MEIDQPNGIQEKIAFKTHRIRFFTPCLASIHCMSLNEEIKKLAVVRRNLGKNPNSRPTKPKTTVKLWNNSEQRTYFVEKVFLENDEQPSIIQSIGLGNQW